MAEAERPKTPSEAYESLPRARSDRIEVAGQLNDAVAADIQAEAAAQHLRGPQGPVMPADSATEHQGRKHISLANWCVGSLHCMLYHLHTCCEPLAHTHVLRVSRGFYQLVRFIRALRCLIHHSEDVSQLLPGFARLLSVRPVDLERAPDCLTSSTWWCSLVVPIRCSSLPPLSCITTPGHNRQMSTLSMRSPMSFHGSPRHTNILNEVRRIVTQRLGHLLPFPILQSPISLGTLIIHKRH